MNQTHSDKMATDKDYKTLLIIRHAKSSWKANITDDFNRPLNERGLNDAPEMALKIKNKKIAIDSFVSSPANRAKTTAENFAAVFGVNKNSIQFIPALYHAAAKIFFEVISQQDDSINTLAIFSHNPGITEFVNQLTKNVQLDNMPTCGIFAVKIKTSKWNDFNNAEKEFLFFDYPKNG